MCYIKALVLVLFFVSSSENYFPYKETTKDMFELAEKAVLCSAEQEAMQVPSFPFKPKEELKTPGTKTDSFLSRGSDQHATCRFRKPQVHIFQTSYELL